MNVDKMTEQFKSALVEAQSIALGYESATIEPYHMLQALLNQKEGTTIPLFGSGWCRYGKVSAETHQITC